MQARDGLSNHGQLPLLNARTLCYVTCLSVDLLLLAIERSFEYTLVEVNVAFHLIKEREHEDS